MLSDKEFAERISAWNLPAAGIDYLRRVRTSPPSRNVASHGAVNTTWRYASHKMACTIQGESTLERDFLVRCEYLKGVAEFWDQPETVSVTFSSKIGRVQRVPYTADILVIEDNGVTAYQVKPRVKCDRLVEQRPSRWARRDHGYVDISATEVFAGLGIRHRVVTEDDIDAVTAENFALLLQARRSLVPDDLDLTRRIERTLADEGVTTIGDLMRIVGTPDTTPLLRLIDEGRVTALLDKHRLADHEDALVGLNREDVEEVSLVRSQSTVQSGMLEVPHAEAPSLGQIKVMLSRQRQLSCREASSVSKKTLRRWQLAINAANGDVRALISKTNLRGNRSRRIGQEDLALISQVISDRVLVPNPGTTKAAYRAYVNWHIERHSLASVTAPARPVSLRTFFTEVARIPMAQRGAAQGGARMANALAPPVAPNLRSLTPLRPFERAHIDHYLIDQHVVLLRLGKNKKITKRAWLTVMIDQATKVVFSISISFRSPSRRACACVIRDCVRRHGRLPETIVVDHGAEFESTYFEALLARYGVTKHERPPHAPRFGGQIESTFHSIREELIRSLDGSTSNDERGRAISPSHRGQALSSWELRQVYEAYESYFYRHFNLKVRGTSICSADNAYDELITVFPCSGISLTYNETFLIATAVPLNQKFTVTHNRGITHHGRWYFHPGLLHTRNGAKVDVLEDPWDDGRLYASVNGKWLTCLSSVGHSAHGSLELRMLRSIAFLETQSLRREQALAQQVTLESEVAQRRKTSGSTSIGGPKAKRTANRSSRQSRPQDPTGSRPSPFLSHEGHLDGHPNSRK